MKTLIPITAMMAFCQIFLLSMFIPSANAATDPFIDEIIRPFMEKVDENGKEKDRPEWDLAIHWLLVEVENDPEYANGWFFLAKSVVLMLRDPRRIAIPHFPRLDPPGLLRTSLRNYLRLDPYQKKLGDRVLRARSEDAARLDKIVRQVVSREYNPKFRNGFANADEMFKVMGEILPVIRSLETFRFQEDLNPLKKPKDVPGISDEAKFEADSTVVLAAAMWLKEEGVSSFRLRQLCDVTTHLVSQPLKMRRDE